MHYTQPTTFSAQPLDDLTLYPGTLICLYSTPQYYSQLIPPLIDTDPTPSYANLPNAPRICSLPLCTFFVCGPGWKCVFLRWRLGGTSHRFTCPSGFEVPLASRPSQGPGLAKALRPAATRLCKGTKTTIIRQLDSAFECIHHFTSANLLQRAQCLHHGWRK